MVGELLQMGTRGYAVGAYVCAGWVVIQGRLDAASDLLLMCPSARASMFQKKKARVRQRTLVSRPSISRLALALNRLANYQRGNVGILLELDTHARGRWP